MWNNGAQKNKNLPSALVRRQSITTRIKMKRHVLLSSAVSMRIRTKNPPTHTREWNSNSNAIIIIKQKAVICKLKLPTTWNLHQLTPTSVLFYHRWAHSVRCTLFCRYERWTWMCSSHTHIMFVGTVYFRLRCATGHWALRTFRIYTTLRTTVYSMCAQKREPREREKCGQPYGDTILLFKSYTLQSLSQCTINAFEMEMYVWNEWVGERKRVCGCRFSSEMLRLVLLCAFLHNMGINSNEMVPAADIEHNGGGWKNIWESVARHERLQQ